MQPVEAITLKALLDAGNWSNFGPILKADLFSCKETRSVYGAIRTLHESGLDTIPFSDLESHVSNLGVIDCQPVLEAMSDVDVTPETIRAIVSRHIQNQLALDVAEACGRFVTGADVSLLTLAEQLRNAGELEAPRTGALDYLQAAGVYDDSVLLRKAVPLGLHPEMDEHFRGGIGAGELLSFIGTPGAGKTLLLVNIGAYNFTQGRKVFHATTEESGPHCANRYDGTLGVSPSEAAKRGGKLWIQDISQQAVTPQLLESLVRREATEHPDLVIVDYADELVSSRKFQEKRHELSLIYKELREIGVRLDVPVITATQANRQAMMKDRIGLEEIAESFGIARKSDHIIAINPEEEEGMVVLQVLKARRRARRKRPSWGVYINFDTGAVERRETMGTCGSAG